MHKLKTKRNKTKSVLCSVFQYQYDSEQLSESLTKLNSTLDPKTLSKKSKTEKLLQLEVRPATSTATQHT